ncbi:MAG TPA: hypothetical protein VGQ46_00425 [Thermoanaerobaculia bacterium]|jgi:hypothetical protein|nr:hypothetical protein [Thermoanaerobaculia bacterium]
MTRVQALQLEIEKRSLEEFAQLRAWFFERDAALWDGEIERDAASGKLDGLFARSLADHHAGKSREI